MSPSDPHASFASFADMEMLNSALGRVFAPWVREVDPRVLSARAREETLALPVTDEHVHEGGVLCGQTMMAACDTAMVLAVMTKLCGLKAMTTVQLQTSFLRPVSGGNGAVRVVPRVPRVLRMRRSLVFGEMHVVTAADELAAHTTSTYAVL